jgi:putative sigma-54 modulation protein
MKLDITGRSVDVTVALREFTEDKLRKLERLVDGPSEAHVVLRIDKHRQSAEIQFKSRSIVLSGTEETDDLYVSIGEVVDKLERQLLKHKEKVRDHRHRKGTRAPEAVAAIEADAAEAQGAPGLPVGEATSRIVRSHRYRIKPMSAEDAAMELDATNEDLLVFREAQTYRINVLYRQKDGNLALIDPEF